MLLPLKYPILRIGPPWGGQGGAYIYYYIYIGATLGFSDSQKAHAIGHMPYLKSDLNRSHVTNIFTYKTYFGDWEKKDFFLKQKNFSIEVGVVRIFFIFGYFRIFSDISEFSDIFGYFRIQPQGRIFSASGHL